MENRTGFFAIVGKPNVGKSSLLNAIVGQKISIVSYKPQTTRNKITGIYSKDNLQLVFLDTPGFIKPDNLLSQYMAKEISTATSFVDGVIFVVDCTSQLDSKTVSILKNYSKQSLIIAINKVDIGGFDKVYPLIEQLKSILPLATIIPLSAKTNENITVLIDSCSKLAPLGVSHYDSEQVTDRTMRFLASEIIREKILLNYEEEIPHGVSVVITNFVAKPKVTVIEADIICIKDSHKPILIGKNGESLKHIGKLARLDLQSNMDTKVYLQLFVKVRSDWKNSNNYISDFGYKTDKA